jgi:NAD(P)-dependent dehydrogenase (short-subunit alcohol dehydrogenase family)
VMAFSFEGKAVLVTGANRGIGYAVAREFAQAGADLMVLSEDASIVEAAQELEALSGRSVMPLHCDIADRAAVSRIFEKIEHLDVLVNNAGLQYLTPIDEAGDAVEDRFRRVMDVNVMGSFYMTREALPHMECGGRILFTASVWSKTAVSGYSGYCASKHAVLGMLRSLAQELGPRGITVNGVCPGWVNTLGAMDEVEADAKRLGISTDELVNTELSRQALPGMMEPDDMASTYLFLASDAAANITGQTIHCDRGEMMD